MQNTLSKLWSKYNLLSSFKDEMNKKGYSLRDLYCIQIQLNLLREIIELESNNILSELLKKTFYRLLKHIDRGIEYLPDIISNSEEWVLNPIEKDKDAWISKDVLIFSTKTNVVVYSKIIRKNTGYKYIDSKWQ